MPTIGVSLACSRALGERAPEVPHRRRRRGRAAHPHPHHPAAAARGVPTATWTASSQHLGLGGRAGRSRSGCTCAAPAPSGRSRRWSSSAWSRGSASASSWLPSVRQGPLVIERMFPYHPHVTVAHHLPEAQLERAFIELETYDAAVRRERDVDVPPRATRPAGSRRQAFPLGSSSLSLPRGEHPHVVGARDSLGGPDLRMPLTDDVEGAGLTGWSAAARPGWACA